MSGQHYSLTSSQYNVLNSILQICEGIQNEEWEVVDPNPGAHGPYAHNKDGLWVGYDDEEIAREKVNQIEQIIIHI